MGKEKIEIENLGELVHKSNYEIEVEENDANGHLNNSMYGVYAEKIRQKLFLPRYGFSDKWFNERGFRQVRRELSIFFKKGIEASNKMDVGLELFVEDKIWFHMIFDFIRPDKNLAAKMYTTDYFMKKKKGIFVPCRKVPQFFIDAIKNI